MGKRKKQRKRKRKQRTKRKTQKIRRRRTKKRPTQTKRRKRKRKRRSPSNLAQDHYINKNKKNLLNPIPLETLLPCPLPRPSNPRKEKDLHKQQALAHSTSFPMTSYLLGVGRSYGRSDGWTRHTISVN